MPSDSIPFSNWDKDLQEGLVNFFNYLLSGGFKGEAVREAAAAADYVSSVCSIEEAARFRQEQLGGFITAVEQLLMIPGITQEDLEQIASLVCQMNLDHLRLLAPQTTRRNQVEAFVNGPYCLQVLLEEIGRAQRYIHFSVMLFFSDDSGHRVAQALLDARARGVEVRLVVDEAMTRIGYNHTPSFGEFGKFAEALKAAGAQVRNSFGGCYSKEEWPLKRQELAARGVPESHLFLQDYVQKEVIAGLNIINHRKFMIVDGHTLVIGSINVGDQYIGDTPILTSGDTEVNGMPLGIPGSEAEWHDGCFRIRGEAAHIANRIFASQWTVLEGDVFDPDAAFYNCPDANLYFGDETCTLVASFAGNPVNLNQQYHLDLLRYAGDETIIVNPYLIDEAFWSRLQEMEAGQARHITICNPLHINDHPTNLAAVRSHMYGPFEQGVSFYDYSETGRFSHWKISYDHRAQAVFHGSYNLNERSACHDFELGILVQGRAFADKVKRMIDYDLQVSRRVTDGKAFFKHPQWHPSTYLNRMTKSLT